MNATRKLAAILAADVAGYSRLVGADEEGTIARLQALRCELIAPTIGKHHGRIVKTTGDGLLVEFASVVDAVRCAVEVQRAMVERHADLPADKRIEFRVGINLGDVVTAGEDLLGDGVNVAARLEGIADPGGICISGAAHEQVRDKLPLTFADLGEQQLKNIERAIRVYSITNQTGASSLAGHAPARLSLVVLPFSNLSGDPAHDPFADAITENLTTDLARFAQWFVIARNTAFTYKGKPVSMTQLRRDLGVSYAIEGAIQYGANRIRVNVQLIDAQSGAHVWADRFDKTQADSLELQEEITTHIARSVDVRLRELNATPGPSGTGGAAELSMRASTVWYRQANRENYLAALRLCEEAERLDNSNAGVLAGLVFMKANGLLCGWSTALEDDIRNVTDVAARAFAIDPANPRVFLARGLAFLLQRKPEVAILAFERLVELNPAAGFTHGFLGYAKVCAGRLEEGVRDIHDAIRLMPRDPTISEVYHVLGIGYLCLGERDKAITSFERSVALNGKMDVAHIWLASLYADTGRIVEARQEIDAALELLPDWSVRKFQSIILCKFPDFVIEGLRMAGLPED
jgi:adenylate cyclase